ncbi:Swt1 family HEPN domain-containing protein [Asticcacaulis tiandongensis]|uniref:Swt1 family HEPN domain-containing protein n=1 Tax=Asticcacaulis tiandongensis TaxID=2565365 RepID=UPI00112EBE60|nr:Swt1 family HEPN domain-containing protein [Asticcacaulis tiandongensis]
MSDEFRRLFGPSSSIDDLARGIRASRIDELAGALQPLTNLQKALEANRFLTASGMLDAGNKINQMAMGLPQTRAWEIYTANTALNAERAAMDSTRGLPSLSATVKCLDRMFRMPPLAEASNLLQRISSYDAGLKSMVTGLGLRTNFTQLQAPWLDTLNPMRSATAFAALQSLASVATHGSFGDTDINILVRQSLGDWRDEATVSEATTHVSRTALYTDQGVDLSLTDFPEESFLEIVEVIGLAYNEDYTGIPGATAFDEEGLRRNHDAYDRLIRFEQVLRQFLAFVMNRQFGPAWFKQRVPGAILENWRRKRKGAIAAGQAPLDFVEYADFMDYFQIITRTDNWDELFVHIFVRPEDVRESFNRMHPVRNADMHARIITPDDLMLITFETQRLFRRMRAFSITSH